MYRNTVKIASFLLLGSHFADQLSSNDFSLFYDDVFKIYKSESYHRMNSLFKIVNDVTNMIAILTKDRNKTEQKHT